jgi:hypothetical protein
MLSQLTVVSWTASCPGKLTPYKPLQAFFAAFGASFDVSKQTCPGQSWVNALRVGEGGGGGGGVFTVGADKQYTGGLFLGRCGNQQQESLFTAWLDLWRSGVELSGVVTHLEVPHIGPP